MSEPAIWRPATLADLDAMMGIQAIVHSLMQERPAVFAAKLKLCPGGCAALASGGGAVIGYGLAHPWRLDEAPPLDAILEEAPEAADCLFLHDVALLPAARGQGAARAFVQRSAAYTQKGGLGSLALISVYGTVPIWEACGFALRTVPAMASKLATYGETARYMTARIA